MPDEFDAPVEQATAAPGEKRQVVVRPTAAHVIVCPHCGGAIPDPETDQ
jgi:hypothetical protein